MTETKSERDTTPSADLRAFRDGGDFPAAVVVRTLWTHFLPYRRLQAVPREARTGVTDRVTATVAEEPTRDVIVTEMEHRGYLRIDARRQTARGALDHVIILVLSADGKYAHFSPDLRALLGGLGSEPATQGRLDEVMIVVEAEFFRKKNLIEVIKKFQEKEAGGADAAGAGPIYNVFPYHVFSNDVPKNGSVVPHSIMTDEEVRKYMTRERLGPKDIFSVSSSDPAVIWLGARPGQFVEVERLSETAATAFAPRYVTKAPLG